MATDGVATPSAAFKMISIPEALDIVLAETHPLPSEAVPFQRAFQQTLAEDVQAAEPVPGYRASIKASPFLASLTSAHSAPCHTHTMSQNDVSIAHDCFMAGLAGRPSQPPTADDWRLNSTPCCCRTGTP